MSNQQTNEVRLPDDFHMTIVAEDEKALDANQRVSSVCLADHALGFVGKREDGSFQYVRYAAESPLWLSVTEAPEVDDLDYMPLAYHPSEVNDQMSFCEQVAIVPVKYMPFFGDGTIEDIDIFTLKSDNYPVPK